MTNWKPTTYAAAPCENLTCIRRRNKGAQCSGRRKVSTMSQVFSSIQYICFGKTSGSNMGAPNSGVTRGDICPRAQHFGAAELRSECYILITKCRMSLRNLMKITKVRKTSNYEPKWRFKAEFQSPAISARL